MKQLTEEQELLLDCWLQFAYPNSKGGYHDAGLSTLEDLYSYLLENWIINENGRRNEDLTLPN